MKSIRSFFLGALTGLGIAAALLVGLYLSPLREPLYFRADPDLAYLKERLEAYQEGFTRDELRIAREGVVPDSLRAGQAKVRKDYLRRRGEISELTKVHARATPGGFGPWVHSLRLAAYPLMAVLALGPGLFLAWRTSRRTRVPRPSPRAAGGPAPGRGRDKQEAMKSFEEAVRQVARIAEEEPKPPPAARPAVEPQRAADDRTRRAEERKTEFLQVPPLPEGEEPSPYETGNLEVGPPETKPFPSVSGDPRPDQGPAALRKKDRDTEFLQMGPGWGETLRPPESGPGGRGPAAPAGAGLSMEDEDGEGELEDEDAQAGPFMPPTTEVERIERRKAEVLKLARRGVTSSEISRRLRMSQDEVEFIIRLRREKG